MKNFILILFSIVLLAGCITSRKTQSHGGHNEDGHQIEITPLSTPTPSGEPTPEENAQSNEAIGPKKLEIRPFTVIIGPGQAKALSAAGVLKVFSENKIPVGAIVGYEMGAFIACVYALDNNPNRFEWNLSKIKEASFKDPGYSLASILKKPGSGRAFLALLDEIFSNKRLEDLKIPVYVALQNEGAQEVNYFKNGSIKEILRAAVGEDSLFEKVEFELTRVESAKKFRDISYEELGLNNSNPVVAIIPDNTFGSHINDVAEISMYPNSVSISPSDFGKKRDAILAGKEAAQQKLKDIRQILGIDF